MAFSHKENAVYVADTYNHKIKRIDVATNNCETCNIREDSKELMVFNEPGGLCLSPTGEYLYVANTNNHSIEMIDLSTMISKPFKISFNNTNLVPQHNFNDESVTFSTVKVSVRGGEINFTITLNYSSDIYLTAGAPQKWKTHLPNERWSIKKGNGTNIEQTLNLELSVSSGMLSDFDNIMVTFVLNLCAKDVCFLKRFTLNIPVAFSDDGLEHVNENVLINVSRDLVQL